MKRLIYILLGVMIFTNVYSQDEFINSKKHEIFLKGSFGTSWIILPKVFLLNPDADQLFPNAQVLPAINSISGSVGVQTVFHLGDGWLFVPELDLSYISGEIRVNRTDISIVNGDTIYSPSSVQKPQSYVRAEVPLHFGVRSRDNFWVSFGPSLYFTLYDNKGFEEAVLADPLDESNPAKVNSANPFGIRFRLAAYASVGERSYIDIKFESDLGQYFEFENDTYKAKFSLQNLSIGYGYWLNKK